MPSTAGFLQEPLLALRSGVGILIRNAINRRLVESASLQLELDPVHLDEESSEAGRLADLELIVADDAFGSEGKSTPVHA